METSRLRLEFAAEAFLQRMRSALAKRHPAHPAKGKSLADYSPADAADLMSAIQTAIVAASPAADDNFKTWVDKRADTTRETSI